MAKKQAPSEREFLGYLPPPPGDGDPFEERPRAKLPTIVPSDAGEDDTPFEDELSSPYGIAAEPKPPDPLPPAGPDPRELARRLAEEARAKARAADPRRTKEKPQPEPEPEPAPAPPPRRNRLAERAGGRLVSAEEALKRAAEREAAESKARKKSDRAAARAAATAVLAEDDDDGEAEAEPRRRRRPADSLPPREATPRPPPAREHRPPAAPDHEPTPPIDVAAAITRIAPGAEVFEVVPLNNALVFRALWTAHRARAWATKDLGLLATAAVLLDAVDRVPAGHLVGVRANVGGRLVAAWVDTSRGVVLGLTEPPEVYLAGL